MIGQSSTNFSTLPSCLSSLKDGEETDKNDKKAHERRSKVSETQEGPQVATGSR